MVIPEGQLGTHVEPYNSRGETQVMQVDAESVQVRHREELQVKQSVPLL